MNEYILERENIGTLVERLSQAASVYAPVREENTVALKQVTHAREIAFDYQNFDVPPKKIPFPQTETMFDYSLGKDPQIKASPEDTGKKVLFGIRPCDAKSFVILDKVFEGNFSDVYYITKRQKTTLIGLACTTPYAQCFCTSLGGGPADKDALDILLTPLENESYFVDVVTEKGKGLAESLTDLFVEASDTQNRQKEEAKKNAEALVKRHIEVDGIKEKLDSIFSHQIWTEFSKSCIGCSICTYLCPTCHCFDIQDEATLQEGKRVRVWDTCSNPEYTLHASGHNPRSGRMHRTRNRIYHKYNYYPINSDVIACVGCGRCISKCPVNIDILDMLAKVKELEIDA
ncbi:MAG: (4Fe-4S)-binding protein [bacterium]|nr:(4Fe-4S)-binding protein [bacterium]